MYFTALDLGSSQIKALVGEVKKDNQLLLAGLFKAPAAGFRKGEVVAAEDAIHSLQHIFSEIRQLDKLALKNIFINVNGSNVKLQSSRGIIAVSRADNEIYQEDVDRVIKASQAVSIGPNRMILHTLTKEFIIDGEPDILDPLGMTGTRLEVVSLIIDAFKPAVTNLAKCIEIAHGKVTGPIYNPLAMSRAVLSKMQKELGAVCIDIGAGTTGMAVYEEDELLQATVFPVGAANITNDLAIGLRSPIKTAERIKLSFGSALSKDVSNKERIELQEVDDGLKGSVSRRFVAEIIEVRLEEIFEFVINELKLIGKMGQLPAGVVLTGGGAKIPGIVELAKQELKLPVQIGTPDIQAVHIASSELGLRLEDPEFSVVAGLLLWGRDELTKNKSWAGGKNSWFSNIFKHFLP